MTSIVLVTRDFPPYCGQTGWMIRVATLADFLVAKGYDVTVVAIRRSRRFDLLAVNPSVHVKWVFSIFEYYRYDDRAWLRRPMNLLAALFLFVKRMVGKEPYDRTGLFLGVYRRAFNKINDAQEISNVIISTPPHSLQQIAVWIKQRNPSINVLSDFRDGWSVRPMYAGTLSLRYKAEECERRIFETVDRVLVVSSGMRKVYGEKYSVANTVVMENGYSNDTIAPAGFEFSAAVDRFRSEGRIVLGYFGSGSVGRDGEEQDLTMLFRVIEEDGALIDRFAIVLQGRLSVERKFTSKASYSIHSPAAHSQVLGNMQLVDVGVNLNMSSEYAPCVIGGKVYEYIYTSRPVLIVAPDEAISLKEIVQDTGGYFANVNDRSQMRETFHEISSDYRLRRGAFGEKPDSGCRKKYSRDSQYKKLLELLIHDAADEEA